MRQLAPASNLVLAVFAGLGLLASLTLPWFAAPSQSPNSTDGPVERGAYQVEQVFATSAKGMVDGTDALGSGQTALLVLVGVVTVLGVLIGANVMRHKVEDVLHLVALAAPIVVLAVALPHPGTDADLRIHYGLIVGLAATLLMSSAAWHGASMRAKHKAPVRPRYGSAPR